MAVIFILTLLNLMYPKDQTVSAVENRNLAANPEFTADALLSGQYFRDFESFFADHFFKREKLVGISKKISAFNGISLGKEVSIVDFEGQNVGGENSGGKSAETETKGNLLILNDTVMEIYKFNSDKSKLYAEMINSAQKRFGGNVKVYSLLAPIQIEFLEEKKYKELSDSQIDAIKYINGNFTEEIIPADAYEPVREHIGEYVYYRTDHHWTALGAYYGYTGFAKAAGFEAIPLDEFKEREASGYLGHISTVNPSQTVNSNPDDVVYYIPPVKSEMKVYYYDKETGEKKSYEGDVISKSYINTDQKYGVFLGGDFPLGIIKTKADTDKKIMVIKDSYGNAFVPFLVPHYSEIYVVDPRYCKENIAELIEENNIGEVLFLNYILTTNFKNYMDSVLNLIK